MKLCNYDHQVNAVRLRKQYSQLRMIKSPRNGNTTTSKYVSISPFSLDSEVHAQKNPLVTSSSVNGDNTQSPQGILSITECSWTGGDAIIVPSSI